MSELTRITGIAAPLPTANLDTDQIMPKQFLRGIDKSGLAKGLLYDMRFDADDRPVDNFVLNRPEYAQASVLVGTSNFGCGSSREHAVWGLQQFGIRAIIASSFGEIFYSNAMNNRLLLVMLPDDTVQAILADVSNPATNKVTIDVGNMTVRSDSVEAAFSMSARHRHMFMNGLDMIGATLSMGGQIAQFQQDHWRTRPWLRDVAYATRSRLAKQRA